MNQIYLNGTILIVDDDPGSLVAMHKYFSKKAKKILTAKDGIEALELYKEERPDIIFSDIEMPRLSGIDMIKEIRRNDSKTIIFIITAFIKESYLLEATRLHLEDFIQKPILLQNLEKALIKAIQKLEKGDTPICKKEKISYSYSSKKIIYKDKDVALSNMEIDFLELLLSLDGGIATYETIEDVVYKSKAMSKDSIKTLVKRVRKKLVGVNIENKPEIGYYLLPPNP